MRSSSLPQQIRPPISMPNRWSKGPRVVYDAVPTTATARKLPRLRRIVAEQKGEPVVLYVMLTMLVVAVVVVIPVVLTADDDDIAAPTKQLTLSPSSEEAVDETVPDMSILDANDGGGGGRRLQLSSDPFVKVVYPTEYQIPNGLLGFTKFLDAALCRYTMANVAGVSDLGTVDICSLTHREGIINPAIHAKILYKEDNRNHLLYISTSTADDDTLLESEDEFAFNLTYEHPSWKNVAQIMKKDKYVIVEGMWSRATENGTIANAVGLVSVVDGEEKAGGVPVRRAKVFFGQRKMDTITQKQKFWEFYFMPSKQQFYFNMPVSEGDPGVLQQNIDWISVANISQHTHGYYGGDHGQYIKLVGGEQQNIWCDCAESGCCAESGAPLQEKIKPYFRNKTAYENNTNCFEIDNSNSFATYWVSNGSSSINTYTEQDYVSVGRGFCSDEHGQRQWDIAHSCVSDFDDCGTSCDDTTNCRGFTLGTTTACDELEIECTLYVSNITFSRNRHRVIHNVMQNTCSDFEGWSRSWGTVGIELCRERAHQQQWFDETDTEDSDVSGYDVDGYDNYEGDMREVLDVTLPPGCLFDGSIFYNHAMSSTKCNATVECVCKSEEDNDYLLELLETKPSHGSVEFNNNTAEHESCQDRVGYGGRGNGQGQCNNTAYTCYVKGLVAYVSADDTTSFLSGGFERHPLRRILSSVTPISCDDITFQNEFDFAPLRLAAKANFEEKWSTWKPQCTMETFKKKVHDGVHESKWIEADQVAYDQHC